MGFLERAIRNGIRKGLGDAIGDAVKKAVEPAATQLADKVAGAVDQATDNARQAEQAQTQAQTQGFEGAMANLQRSFEGYATQAAKNIKVCPNCEATATADQTFCPNCGTRLPEQTLAQGALCPDCGRQNTPGTKFCAGCGAKLPATLQQEQAQARQDAAIMAQWEQKLSQYPLWSCGGGNYAIEEMDGGYLMFAADFAGDPNAAYAAVKQYRQVLLDNGFRQAGQYPSQEHLYKKVEGVCYHVDTEHCFDGDSDCPTIYFNIGEPSGGFDYVKPEPPKKLSWRDLFR